MGTDKRRSGADRALAALGSRAAPPLLRIPVSRGVSGLTQPPTAPEQAATAGQHGEVRLRLFGVSFRFVGHGTGRSASAALDRDKRNANPACSWAAERWKAWCQECQVAAWSSCRAATSRPQQIRRRGVRPQVLLPPGFAASYLGRAADHQPQKDGSAGSGSGAIFGSFSPSLSSLPSRRLNITAATRPRRLLRIRHLGFPSSRWPLPHADRRC